MSVSAVFFIFVTTVGSPAALEDTSLSKMSFIMWLHPPPPLAPLLLLVHPTCPLRFFFVCLFLGGMVSPTPYSPTPRGVALGDLCLQNASEVLAGGHDVSCPPPGVALLQEEKEEGGVFCTAAMLNDDSRASLADALAPSTSILPFGGEAVSPEKEGQTAAAAAADVNSTGQNFVAGDGPGGERGLLSHRAPHRPPVDEINQQGEQLAGEETHRDAKTNGGREGAATEHKNLTVRFSSSCSPQPKPSFGKKITHSETATGRPGVWTSPDSGSSRGISYFDTNFSFGGEAGGSVVAFLEGFHTGCDADEGVGVTSPGLCFDGNSSYSNTYNNDSKSNYCYYRDRANNDQNAFERRLQQIDDFLVLGNGGAEREGAREGRGRGAEGSTLLFPNDLDIDILLSKQEAAPLSLKKLEAAEEDEGGPTARQIPTTELSLSPTSLENKSGKTSSSKSARRESDLTSGAVRKLEVKPITRLADGRVVGGVEEEQAVAQAKNDIDRMISSLLEDVLPATTSKTSQQQLSSSTGVLPDSGSGERVEQLMGVTAGGVVSSDIDYHHHGHKIPPTDLALPTGTADGNYHHTGSESSSKRNFPTRRAKKKKPTSSSGNPGSGEADGGGGSRSRNDSGGGNGDRGGSGGGLFLTPIEVLMQIPTAVVATAGGIVHEKGAVHLRPGANKKYLGEGRVTDHHQDAQPTPGPSNTGEEGGEEGPARQDTGRTRTIPDDFRRDVSSLQQVHGDKDTGAAVPREADGGLDKAMGGFPAPQGDGSRAAEKFPAGDAQRRDQEVMTDIFIDRIGGGAEASATATPACVGCSSSSRGGDRRGSREKARAGQGRLPPTLWTGGEGARSSPSRFSVAEVPGGSVTIAGVRVGCCSGDYSDGESRSGGCGGGGISSSDARPMNSEVSTANAPFDFGLEPSWFVRGGSSAVMVGSPPPQEGKKGTAPGLGDVENGGVTAAVEGGGNGGGSDEVGLLEALLRRNDHAALLRVVREQEGRARQVLHVHTHLGRTLRAQRDCTVVQQSRIYLHVFMVCFILLLHSRFFHANDLVASLPQVFRPAAFLFIFFKERRLRRRC